MSLPVVNIEVKYRDELGELQKHFFHRLYPLRSYKVKIKDFLETFQGKKDVTSVFADIDLDGDDLNGDEDESAAPKRHLKYMDQLV